MSLTTCQPISVSWPEHLVRRGGRLSGFGAFGTQPTIQQGSSNTAVVKLWQNFVGVKADGIFGPDTTTATQGFQRARGLTADGIVGPLTWAAADAIGGSPTKSFLAASTSRTPIVIAGVLGALAIGGVLFVKLSKKKKGAPASK